MNPEDENSGKSGEHELHVESLPSESNGDQTSSIGDTESTCSARYMYTPEATADFIGATHSDCDKNCQGFLYDAVILTPDKHNEGAFKLKTWLEQNLRLPEYDGEKHCARIELLGNIRPDSYAGSLESALQQTKTVILHCVKGFEGDAMFKEAMNDLWPFKSQGLRLCPLLVNFGKEDKLPSCIPVWTAHTLRWEDRDSAHFRDAMVKRLSFTLIKRLRHDKVRRECEKKRNLLNRRPGLEGPQSLQWFGSAGIQNDPCSQQLNAARKGEEDTTSKSTHDSGFSSALTSNSTTLSYAADGQLLSRECSSGPHGLSAQRECHADVHIKGTNEFTARNSSSAQLCSHTRDDIVGSGKDGTMERPNAEAQRMTDVNRECAHGRPTENPQTQYIFLAGKNRLDGYVSMLGTDKRTSRVIESKPRRDVSTTAVVADMPSPPGRDSPLDSKECSQSKQKGERSECSYQLPPPAKDSRTPSGGKLLLTHSEKPKKSVDCDGAQTLDTRNCTASEKQPQGPTEENPTAEQSTTCPSESENAPSVTSQTNDEGDIVSDLDTDGCFNANNVSGTEGESPKHRTPHPSSSFLDQPLEPTTATSSAMHVKNGCPDSHDEYKTDFQDERNSRGASEIGFVSHASAEEKHEREPPAGCENSLLNRNDYLTPVADHTLLSHEQPPSYDIPYNSRDRAAFNLSDEEAYSALLTYPCDEDSKSMDVNYDNKHQIEIDAASVTDSKRVSAGQNDVSTDLSKIKTDFQNNLKSESTSEALCITRRNCHGLQKPEKSHGCRIEPRGTNSTLQGPVSCLRKKTNNTPWYCSQALEDNKSDTDDGSVVLRPGTLGTIHFGNVGSVIVHNCNSMNGHQCCCSEEAVADTGIPVDSHKTLPTAHPPCSSHIPEGDYDEIDGSLEIEKGLGDGHPDLPPRGPKQDNLTNVHPYQNPEWALGIDEQTIETTSSSLSHTWSRLRATLCCGRKKKLAKNLQTEAS